MSKKLLSREMIWQSALEQSSWLLKWQIRNLNEKNVTYVNGVSVESKTVSETDKIELGE